MYRDLNPREKEVIAAALDADSDLKMSKLVELRTLQEIMRDDETLQRHKMIKHLEATLGVETGIIKSQRNLSFFIRRYKIRIHSPLILPEQF